MLPSHHFTQPTITCSYKSLTSRYVSEFESTLLDGAVTESDADFTSRLVGNPVHAFNLIRRFSIDIPNIEKDIKEDDWKGGSKVI